MVVRQPPVDLLAAASNRAGHRGPPCCGEQFSRYLRKTIPTLSLVRSSSRSVSSSRHRVGFRITQVPEVARWFPRFAESSRSGVQKEARRMGPPCSFVSGQAGSNAEIGKQKKEAWTSETQQTQEQREEGTGGQPLGGPGLPSRTQKPFQLSTASNLKAKEGSAWQTGRNRTRALSRRLLRCRSAGAGASEFGRCLFDMHNPKIQNTSHKSLLWSQGHGAPVSVSSER